MGYFGSSGDMSVIWDVIIGQMLITSPDCINGDGFAVWPLENTANIIMSVGESSSWAYDLSDGDRTSLITVTCNDQGVSGSNPQKAVDGTISNSYAAFPGGNPMDDPVVYDFGSRPIAMDKINFIIFGDGNTVISKWKVDVSDDFVWQGSNNGTDWTTITNIGVDNCVDSEEIVGGPYRHVIFDITDKSTEYRYFRLTALTTGRYPPRDYATYNGFWLYDTRFKYFQNAVAHATNDFGSYLTSADTNGAYSFETETKSAALGSQPDSVTAYLVIEDTTAAMNSDIVLSLSRDGGTTYDAATLVYERDIATGIELWRATKTTDWSSVGTDIKAKVESAAGHEVKIHGLSLAWALG